MAQMAQVWGRAKPPLFRALTLGLSTQDAGGVDGLVKGAGQPSQELKLVRVLSLDNQRIENQVGIMEVPLQASNHRSIRGTWDGDRSLKALSEIVRRCNSHRRRMRNLKYKYIQGRRRALARPRAWHCAKSSYCLIISCTPQELEVETMLAAGECRNCIFLSHLTCLGRAWKTKADCARIGV